MAHRAPPGRPRGAPTAYLALRGLLGTARSGHLGARALAVADSRTVVRAMFLASASGTGLLELLDDAPTCEQLALRAGCRRPERLEAWLWVGAELGELRRSGDRYEVRGRRARAIAGGDRLLGTHYRTMLEYQGGPYAQLPQLLRATGGEGRRDLERYAADIAEVSLAAAPFVTAYLGALVKDLGPRRTLDIGCGTGVYAKVVAGAAPDAEIDAVELSPGVAEAARRQLRESGLEGRVRVHTGDVRSFLGRWERRFDLVTLLNNVYYFDPGERASLYRDLAPMLGRGGELVVVTMVAPGSVAAAHLHFMLTCQAGAAALPRHGELLADLDAAGYEVVEERRLVPSEPLVGVRASLRR